MTRDYFKVVNLETGEEKLTAIPPAIKVISWRNLKGVLDGDARIGFYAAVYGALNRDMMDSVARGEVMPDEFMARLIGWLWEWEPDVATVYDADGRPQHDEHDGDTAGDETDPLP
jgi:hypothetical protein